ncbi:MAG TPA: prolipoprotein diacylglyceryl transferase [Actinomycetota bacterium]
MEILAAIGWKVAPSIGPVSPHGLGIALGYAVAGMLVARRAERIYGIPRNHIWNALTWAVVGVVVGSRLFYVAGHLGDYFPDDPLGIVRIWEGGVVFYGGAIGGVVAAVPYLRRHRISFWQAMDAAAPGFPLGLIFGRIGDLVIGDHLGGPTSLPFGFQYQGGDLPGCPTPGFGFIPGSGLYCPAVGEVVHQTALYDLVNVLVLFPLVLLLSRKRRSDGLLIMAMTAWYAAARFAGDFARPATTYGGLRGTQWVSVALAAVALWRLLRIARGRVQPSPPYEPEPAAAAALAGGEPAAGGEPDAAEESAPEAASAVIAGSLDLATEDDPAPPAEDPDR